MPDKLENAVPEGRFINDSSNGKLNLTKDQQHKKLVYCGKDGCFFVIENFESPVYYQAKVADGEIRPFKV